MTHKHKILIVDDHPTNIEILEEILSDEYELSVAASGEECLEIAPRFEPDLVLLDIMMPGIDGYEVCRRLRNDTALRNTKIIMVSAKAMVSQRLTGYEAGANDYITKPFEEEELLAKVRVFLQLKSAEEVMQARRAGMSEIATGVLHNVGNVLNSVNVSASRVATLIRKTQIEDLVAIADLVEEHADDLAGFLSEDQRSTLLPRFLKELASHLVDTRETALEEMDQLAGNIDHIKRIIRMQQSYAAASGVEEPVLLEEAVEDALRLSDSSLERLGIRVVRSYEEVPRVVTDRHKLLLVLTNLVQNAKDALREAPGERRIELAICDRGAGRVQVVVTDNGSGVKPENLGRIFQHGFTTKRDGHGFGLHSSAIAMKDLGGELEAHSDGPGKGASFTIELPLEAGSARAAA